MFLGPQWVESGRYANGSFGWKAAITSGPIGTRAYRFMCFRFTMQKGRLATPRDDLQQFVVCHKVIDPHAAAEV